MNLPVLPTTFKVQLPRAVQKYLDDILDAYAKNLLVKPRLTQGKTVVEYHDVLAGITYVVRVLVTAEFEPKSVSHSAVLYGKEPDVGYWESWMVTMAGTTTEAGFAVHRVEVCVYREGGWHKAHTVFFGRHSASQTTADGDTWPEPADRL